MSEEKKTVALDENTLDGVTGGANRFDPAGRYSGNTFEEKNQQIADQTNQKLMDFLQKDGENKP